MGFLNCYSPSLVGKELRALEIFTFLMNRLADYHEEIGLELENAYMKFEYEKRFILYHLLKGRSLYLSWLQGCEYSGKQIPLEDFINNFTSERQISEDAIRFLRTLEELLGKEGMWLATQMLPFIPQTIEQIRNPKLYLDAFKETLEELNERIKNGLVAVPIFPESYFPE